MEFQSLLGSHPDTYEEGSQSMEFSPISDDKVTEILYPKDTYRVNTRAMMLPEHPIRQITSPGFFINESFRLRLHRDE